MIALVGCGKAKLDHPAPARELYTGNLFKAAFAYCEARYTQVLIISAYHGLLHPDAIIAPYDTAMTDLSNDQRVQWGRRVAYRLFYPYIIRYEGHVLGTYPNVEIHAGELYVKYLMPPLLERRILAQVPCRGLQIGERLAFYKAAQIAHKDDERSRLRFMSTDQGRSDVDLDVIHTDEAPEES